MRRIVDEVEVVCYSQWDLMSNKDKAFLIFFMVFIFPPLFWGSIALIETNFNDKHICRTWNPHAFMCPDKELTEGDSGE